MSTDAASPLAWLQDHSLGYPSRYRELEAPFVLGEWACASDGKHLVAVKLAPGVVPPGPPVGSEFLAKVQPFLTREAHPDPNLATTLAALRSWCGFTASQACTRCGDTARVNCDDCDGTGDAVLECDRCDRPHDCHCRECDGAGRVPCGLCKRADEAPGFVGSGPGEIYLNRTLLGRALDIRLGSGPVSIEALKSEVALVVRGYDWLVYVCGLTGHLDPFTGTDTRKGVPRFFPRVPA